MTETTNEVSGETQPDMDTPHEWQTPPPEEWGILSSDSDDGIPRSSVNTPFMGIPTGAPDHGPGGNGNEDQGFRTPVRRPPLVPPIAPVRGRSTTVYNPKSRGWNWVLNNYTHAEVENIKDCLGHEGLRYCIYGYEIAPTTGTPHLQGYCEFKNQVRMNIIKSVLGHRVSCKPVTEHKDKAIAYCQKDGHYTEFGTASKGQGTRSDLIRLQADLDAGDNMQSISTNHFGAFLRSAPNIRAYRALHCTTDRKPPRMLVIYGPTRTGKTRRLLECLKGKSYYSLGKGETGCWWTGYDGHSHVLMDDIRGNWMTHGKLLRVFDETPLWIPVHGGLTPLVAEYFYISSNLHPCMWYEEDHAGALMGRMHDFVWLYNCPSPGVYVLEASPNRFPNESFPGMCLRVLVRAHVDTTVFA